MSRFPGEQSIVVKDIYLLEIDHPQKNKNIKCLNANVISSVIQPLNFFKG